MSEPTVPFGSQQVEVGLKQGLVNDVFSRAARDYDKMNDLMSGGLHRLWKDELVSMLAPPRTARAFRVLDVAGGTGDIAFRIVAEGGPGVTVTIADISEPMITEGRRRAEAQHPGAPVDFTVANAEALPFADRSFDAYTIAFGIRNVTHIDRALREAHRVLKPGGRFLCLEFSTVDTPLLAQVYDAYSFTVIPAVGKVVTGDGGPYRYLVESIRTFPRQEAFREMIAQAGFAQASFRTLAFGAVAIHSGWRI